MKKILYSIIMAVACLMLYAQNGYAQGTGNQPVGNLLSAPDGSLYGSFSKKTSSEFKFSLIYKYQPGNSTPDPIYRSDKYELNVQLADSSGFIYGVALDFNGIVPKDFHMFRLKSDGTGFKILRSGSVSTLGIPTIQVHMGNLIYGLRNKGGYYGKGVLFRMNNDGTQYQVTRDFVNDTVRPTQLIVWQYEYDLKDVMGILPTGGDSGKGSVVILTHAGLDGTIIHFTGQGGEIDYKHLDGETPVAISRNPDPNYRVDVYMTTRSGGAHNKGGIYLLSADGIYQTYDFTEQFPHPAGNTAMYGPGGDFENNNGFIFSLNSTAPNYPIVTTFPVYSPVNKVTSVAAVNDVIYGIARTSTLAIDDGALFSVNEDGTNLHVIFPFIDGYSQVKEPVDNETEVYLTPVVKLTAIPGVSMYTLEVSKTSDFSSDVMTFNTASPQLTLPRLKYSTTYYTRVKTDLLNEYGHVTKFTTYPPEKYSVVTNPVDQATNVAINNLKVTANIVFEASIYTIELNTRSDFTGTSIVKTSPFAGQRTITFNNLQPGTTYYSRTQTDLPSGWGPTRSFTTAGSPPPPAVQFAEEQNLIRIYPNPFKSNFSVDVQNTKSEKATIVLYDITGRQLTTVDMSGERTVQLGDDLKQGVYVLKFVNGNTSAVYRLTKR